LTIGSTSAPPRIAVFALGGTIAMTSEGDGGVVPALSAAQLVAAVPGLDRVGAALDVFDFRQLPGASLTFSDVLALAEEIEARVRTGTAGVVVTQGTDTIEETAFLLDLVYPGDAPVVVTGAMRNPTMASPDGPGNILAAAHVAASPEARGLGCLVVFADEIHAARYVRKTHATSTGAFASPNTGPLGYVAEGRAHVLTRPARLAPVQAGPPGTKVRVGLVTVTLDDDGELLRSVAGRFDGLVVAGFGVGHVPDRLTPLLTELAASIPVVLASRTGAGPVLSRTYAFPGSEKDLHDRGLVGAGLLDPYKARILLHLLLTAGAGRDEIIRTFSAHHLR
jgi:L-asparaginase